MQLSESKENTQFVPQGRKCSTCEHESVTAINSLLATGALSNRRIAAQFGLANRSVDRHALEHLPKALVRAAERKEEKAEDVFAERLSTLWNDCQDGVKAAKEAIRVVPDSEGNLKPVGRDLSALAPLLGQCHANLRLYGDRHQLLSQAPTTSVTNNYLAVVIPRPVDQSAPAIEPAIECEALPAGDPPSEE